MRDFEIKVNKRGGDWRDPVSEDASVAMSCSPDATAALSCVVEGLDAYGSSSPTAEVTSCQPPAETSNR